MGLFEAYYGRSPGERAYQNEDEYRSDAFSYIDMCLSALFTYRGMEVEKRWELGLAETVRRDIPVTQEEALRALDFGGSGWQAEKAGEGAGGGRALRQELNRAKMYMMGRLAFTPQRGGCFSIIRLGEKFQLSGPEYFMLLLSMAVYRDAKYEALFQQLEGAGKTSPTLRLAFSLYGLTGQVSPSERSRLIQLKGSLFEYLVVADPEHRGPPGARMFTMSRRVAAFLMDNTSPAIELEGLARIYRCTDRLPPACIREERLERVARFMKSYAGDGGLPRATGSFCNILHLYGENGNGKRFLIRSGAAALGRNLIIADVSRMIGSTMPMLQDMFRVLKLECALTGSILCFVEEQLVQEEEESAPRREFPPMLDCLLDLISNQLDFCVWMTVEKAAYLTRYPLHFMAVESEMLTIGERTALWREFSDGYALEEGVDLTLCANQYILTAAGIREVLHTAEMERISDGRERIARADLLSAIKQKAANQLGSYATLINAVFTWDDLIIDPEQKRQMQMICSQVKYRGVVGEEWGFHKKTPYGRGICAMFYGSPGTGKTMAVQVMANELGLDLYRVDLSQMVSKYIGETEKNISTLFRRAKNINALLFFDEADSLFAKRSEVKDSNDRNANAETAHLLQKLEDYGGITILATNYANNIDDAFKRRIKFMVNFVFPGEEVRRRLWSSIIPDKIRYDEEIDFDFFAKNFELAGSNIKEVLINAAYIAASEDRGLTNKDVVEAIRLNFAKYGKILTQEDFGYLGV